MKVKVAVGIIIIVVVLAAAILYFTPKMEPIQTFACSSLNGFTFDYPASAGLGQPFAVQTSFDVLPGQSQCTVLFGAIPKGAFPTDAPQLRVTKTVPAANPNGVAYAPIQNANGYRFFVTGKNFSVDIIALNFK